MMKCGCGNDRFYASQRSRHDVITDENGNFMEDIEVFQSDNPYGPFRCTKCGQEYESLGKESEEQK